MHLGEEYTGRRCVFSGEDYTFLLPLAVAALAACFYAALLLLGVSVAEARATSL